MSTIVSIKNPNRVIDLSFFKGFLAKEKLYFGVPNQAYVLEGYQKGQDIRNQLLILFRRDTFGRGMSFYLYDNYDLEITLNTPNSENDILMFYQFIKDYCTLLKIDTFTHEDTLYSLDNIDELMNQAISLNRQLIKTFLKADTTLFGAIFPIVIESELISQIKKVDKYEATKLFQEYLDRKQKIDAYFAKPLIYEVKGKKGYIARYALTKDVPTIFPISPYLPYGYDQNLTKMIHSWSVVLVADNKVIKEISIPELWELFDKDQCPRFDANHVIITLTNDQLY